MRTGLAAIWWVMAVAAVACQDPAAPPAATAAAPGSAAADPAAAGAAAAAGPPVQRGAPRVIVMDEPVIMLPKQESFRLTDPGKGARAPLRYALAAGTAAVMIRTALTSRHLERGEFSRPATLPAIRDGFEITVAADHPGQVALRAVAGQSAASSREADAYLAPSRSLLQDHRIALAIDDRGAFTAIQFDDDATGARSARGRDELTQRLLSLIVPLPDEPVGTGASWRVVTILRQASAVVKQTATYTLLARSARRWKLHAKLQRVGQQQQIVDPSMPRGASAELIALFRALEGDVEVDPQLPLIAGGELTIESRLHARFQLAPRPIAPGSPAAPATSPPAAPATLPPASPAAPVPASPPIIEQMFEDTGRLGFSRCRPTTARPSRTAASASLALCPDGFTPR